jgi:methyltransferase (TIGR00027 family)
MKWPGSTNSGTAMMKLLHQKDERRLFEDKFVHWFLDGEVLQNVETLEVPVDGSASSEAEFIRIAYRYSVLREKYFDDEIAKAVRNGFEQLVLLGSGYDTRALRLPDLMTSKVRVIEIDTPATITRKRSILVERLRRLPEYLTLLPLDLNTCDLEQEIGKVLRPGLKTIYLWQGVSYYLPASSVSLVLDSIVSLSKNRSLLLFDCCTPLMLTVNDKVPGIRFNIKRLNEIGEPYLFGMYESDMYTWLVKKGFSELRICKQSAIEFSYWGMRSLPDRMWYTVACEYRGPAQGA